MAFRLKNARDRYYHSPSCRKAHFFFSHLPGCSLQRIISASERRREKKFCHDGNTDKENDISYSVDEIMGLVERENMMLIPAAFSSHCHTGPLLNRLMYGHDTEPHRTFKNRPNANTCKDYARSSRDPHDILGRANHVWRASHSHKFYGGSYKAMDPRTHFDQSLGLIMSTAISSHLLRVHKRKCTTRTVSHQPR